MIFKNTYEITISTDNYSNTILFNNLVTDYGKEQLNKGTGYPSYVLLGSTDEEPSSTSSTITNVLGSYNVSPTKSLDINNRVCTYSYTFTLDESTLVGKTIRQIGIGTSSTKMFTLARFKDSLGKPIDIVKGELERMTVRIVAYVEYSELDNYGWELVLSQMAMGTGAMNTNMFSVLGFSPTINECDIPVITNTYGMSSFSVSGNGLSSTISLNSSTGSGYIDSIAAIKRIDSTNGIHQCTDVVKLSGDYSAKFSLGNIAADTKSFSIPPCTPYRDKIKVYAGDTLLNNGEYTLTASEYSSFVPTNRLTPMYTDTIDILRVSPVEYRYNNSSYSNNCSITLSTIYYYEVDLVSKTKKCIRCNFGDITMSLGSYETKVFSALNNNFVAVYDRREKYMQVIAVKGSTWKYVKNSDGGSTFNCTCTPLCYRDDEYSINIEGTKYTIDPETLDSSITDTKAYVTIAGVPSGKDYTKLSTDKILIHYIPLSSTTTGRYTVNYNTLEMSESIITHASVRYSTTVGRFVDEEDKVIISIDSTGASSSSLKDNSLHIMNDDMTSINKTITLSSSTIAGNYVTGGYNIEKVAKKTYRAYSYYSTTKYYINEITLNEDNTSVNIVDVTPQSTNQLKYIPWVIEPTYGDITVCPSFEQYHNNAYSTIHIPKSFSVEINKELEAGTPIYYSFDTSCIYKSSDWTISASMKVGTE